MAGYHDMIDIFHKCPVQLALLGSAAFANDRLVVLLRNWKSRVPLHFLSRHARP